MPDISVSPYWELTFDAQGDVNGKQRDALHKGVRDERVTDLVMFSHGWNNDRSIATRLYNAFFAPFPELLDSGNSTARVGYVGIVWPSMRWTDEPIPDFEAHSRSAVADDDGTASVDDEGGAAAPSPVGLDQDTQDAYRRAFPKQQDTVEELTALLDARPDDPKALNRFFALARGLIEDGEDGDVEGEADELPAMLGEDPQKVSREFLTELERMGVRCPDDEDDGTAAFGGLKRLWHGAREALRQLTYYQMKKRAGTVGEKGLGPAIGALHRAAPSLRVHLVGHSFGGRLVSFGLRGLPDGAAGCVRSVTLLQAAFSHFAFSESLPFDRGRKGGLHGAQRKVRGPVVVCFSKHDGAVGTLYPIASRVAGDDAAAVGDLLFRWGGMGHDGAQAVTGCTAVAIGGTGPGSGYRFPDQGCVNVDAAQVVRRGGPPAGAHSDICHRELAWVVLSAGRMVG